MRIEILTIHRLNNFGSALQAMALYEYIADLGYDVEIIDYHPAYYNGNKIRNYVGRILYRKNIANREKKFDEFLNRNVRLSVHRYKMLEALEKNHPAADLYIAGGDQLWNYHHICGKDDTYKLVFWHGRKISYGTSMGGNFFSKEQLLDLKSKIKDFETISLREKQSLSLLKEIGLNATWVVDPVMLLPTDRYKKLMIKPKEREKFAFVYLVSPSAILDSAVEYLSKVCKLKIIVYSGVAHKCKCDIQKRELGPEEVLGYIYNAEFVLSSSFHATVFSILFKKKFAVILPGETTNERLFDLLSWTKYEDGIIKTLSELEMLYMKDNWYTDEKEKIIEERVQESKRYLKEAIEGKQGSN